MTFISVLFHFHLCELQTKLFNNYFRHHYANKTFDSRHSWMFILRIWQFSDALVTLNKITINIPSFIATVDVVESLLEILINDFAWHFSAFDISPRRQLLLDFGVGAGWYMQWWWLYLKERDRRRYRSNVTSAGWRHVSNLVG